MGNTQDRERGNSQTWTDRVDVIITDALRQQSSKSSRRTFLSKLARLSIAVTGVAILSALPADRRVDASGGMPCCDDDWKWCGLSGKPCSTCGGTATTCPGTGCVTAGSGWTACCIEPGGCGKIILYKDCCYDGSGSECGAVHCDCDCNKETGIYWCDAAAVEPTRYRCTLTIVTSTNCFC